METEDLNNGPTAVLAFLESLRAYWRNSPYMVSRVVENLQTSMQDVDLALERLSWHFTTAVHVARGLAQFESEDVPVPLPPARLASFCRLLQRGDEVSGNCTICCDRFKQKQNVATLPCAHMFHVDCASPWFATKPTCPLCRHDCRE